MISWKEINKQTCKNLNISEKEGLFQLELYSKYLRKALKEAKYELYDYFFIGKLRYSRNWLKKVSKNEKISDKNRDKTKYILEVSNKRMDERRKKIEQRKNKS